MRRRILVIDDNTAFRGVLGQLLAADGFVVVAGAATGADGVRLAAEHDPEVVMVDVQLPDIDGFEVTERLARLDRRSRGDPHVEPRRERPRDARDGEPCTWLHPEGRDLGHGDRSAARADPLSLPVRSVARQRDFGDNAAHRRRALRSRARHAPIRVALADDSVLLREGIARLLADKGFEIVGQSGTAEDLLLKVRSYSPDIAIVDIKMPPTHTDEGLRAAKEIRERYPDTAVLVLSQYVEEGYALELLQTSTEGVGYLLKDRVYDLTDFVAAVKRVAEGGSALDPSVVSQLVGRRRRDDPIGDLSPREREVLALMAEGLSNSAIAARVFLTERGVEKHVTSIFQKLRLPVAADTHRRVLAVVAFLQS